MEIKATGAEKIAESLRDRILRGEFNAGAPLREEELAARYGVSRHVVREVLRKLTADGVAEYSAFRGARIPLLTADDVDDIYRAREFVECESLAQGSDRIEVQKLATIHAAFAQAVSAEDWSEAFELDRQFHSYIVSAAGSGRLVVWHDSLLMSLKLAHLTVPDFQALGLQCSVPQHADVILALAASDGSNAVTALRRHLDHSKCLLLRGMSDRNEGAPARLPISL